MELLSKSNELLIAKWEQSVDAMDERDQVLKRNAAEFAEARLVMSSFIARSDCFG